MGRTAGRGLEGRHPKGALATACSRGTPRVPQRPSRCRSSTRSPTAGPAGRTHPPSDALGRVLQQHAENVQQTREQLQGEVEEPDPQACREGTAPTGCPRRGSPWPAPRGTAPLTGSLVLDEEELQPLLERVLVDVEFYLDPTDRAGGTARGSPLPIRRLTP